MEEINKTKQTLYQQLKNEYLKKEEQKQIQMKQLLD